MKALPLFTIASVSLFCGSTRRVQTSGIRSPDNERRYLHSLKNYNTSEARNVLQSFLLALPLGRLPNGAGHRRTITRSEIRQARAAPSIRLSGNKMVRRRSVIGSVTKSVLAAGVAPLLGPRKVMAKEATRSESMESENVRLKQSLQDTKAKIANLEQSLQDAKTKVAAAGTSKQTAESKAQEEMTRVESVKSEVAKLETVLKEGKKKMATLEQALEDAQKKMSTATLESTAPDDVQRLTAILQSEVMRLEKSLREGKGDKASLEQELQEAKARAAKAMAMQGPEEAARMERLQSEVLKLQQSLQDAKTNSARVEQSLQVARLKVTAADASKMGTKLKAQDEATRAASLKAEVAKLEQSIQVEREYQTLIESEIADKQFGVTAIGSLTLAAAAAAGAIYYPRQPDERAWRPTNYPERDWLPNNHPDRDWQPPNYLYYPERGGRPRNHQQALREEQYETVLFEPGPLGFTTVNRHMISSVLPGSQSDILGVEPGWRIVAVNGAPCTSFDFNPHGPWEQAINTNRPFYATFRVDRW